MVRRTNNAEEFSGIGVYAFIQDDGKIDENNLTKDEKIELDLKIKWHSVVICIVDSEIHKPMFKHAGKVNNPPEVQAFLRNFREMDKNGTGNF